MNLDAREILYHLNQIGYRHITAEQLKEFMRDLKKLILFESQQAVHPRKSNLQAQLTEIAQKRLPENERKKRISRPCCIKENQRPTVTAQTSSRSSSKQDLRQQEKTPPPPYSVAEEPLKMWIRPPSAKPKVLTTKNDPVALYHAYQKEWERFKPFIPGENDGHQELRWRIRSKMLGS